MFACSSNEFLIIANKANIRLPWRFFSTRKMCCLSHAPFRIASCFFLVVRWRIESNGKIFSCFMWKKVKNCDKIKWTFTHVHIRKYLNSQLDQSQRMKKDESTNFECFQTTLKEVKGDKLNCSHYIPHFTFRMFNVHCSRHWILDGSISNSVENIMCWHSVPFKHRGYLYLNDRTVYNLNRYRSCVWWWCQLMKSQQCFNALISYRLMGLYCLHQNNDRIITNNHWYRKHQTYTGSNVWFWNVF